MRILTLAVLLISMPLAHAEPDLTNCLYPNGLVIEAKVCSLLRSHAERDAEKARTEAVALAEIRRLDVEATEKRAQQEKVDRAANLARSEASERRYKEQAEQSDRDVKAWARTEAAENARLAKAKRARMDECGADFGAPRVGMALERAQRCVGNFTLVSEINRADGVVSTYRYARLYLNVMRGSVVSWHRF